ncbi:MAG: AzlD domain-containing protein [Rhodocyclaceae bacterium]
MTRSSAFLLGVRALAPMLLGVAPFGILYGVVALQSGIPPLAAFLMSSIVFSASTSPCRSPSSASSFVPIAALTAIVTPELLLIAGKLDIGSDNPRFWAGLLAIGVAARWRNTLLTIASGFAAFWLLRWLV